MPRTSVLAYAPRLATIERLVEAKRAWGVSLAALAHRMHTVGMLSDWQYRAVFVEMSKRNLRTNEPAPGPREMSLVFEKIFCALRDDGVSRSDIAKLFGWPLAELNALVFGLVLSVEGAAPTAGFDEPERPHGPTSGPRISLMP